MNYNKLIDEIIQKYGSLIFNMKHKKGEDSQTEEGYAETLQAYMIQYAQERLDRLTYLKEKSSLFYKILISKICSAYFESLSGIYCC